MQREIWSEKGNRTHSPGRKSKERAAWKNQSRCCHSRAKLALQTPILRLYKSSPSFVFATSTPKTHRKTNKIVNEKTRTPCRFKTRTDKDTKRQIPTQKATQACLPSPPAPVCVCAMREQKQDKQSSGKKKREKRISKKNVQVKDKKAAEAETMVRQGRISCAEFLSIMLDCLDSLRNASCGASFSQSRLQRVSRLQAASSWIWSTSAASISWIAIGRCFHCC